MANLKISTCEKLEYDAEAYYLLRSKDSFMSFVMFS